MPVDPDAMTPPLTIADTMITYAISESPFGGVKDSGVGRVNGEMGLKGYCHVQSVVVPRFGGPEALWYPYDSKRIGMLKRGLSLLYRSPLSKLLGN